MTSIPVSTLQPMMRNAHAGAWRQFGHLALWELRRLWSLLALFVAVVLLPVCALLLSSQGSVVASVSALALYPSIFLLGAMSMAPDGPANPTSFIRGRPIYPTALLGSKLVVPLVAIGLAWLTQAIMLTSHGIPIAEVGAPAAQALGQLLPTTLAVMLTGAYAKRLHLSFVSIVGALLLTVLMQMWLRAPMIDWVSALGRVVAGPVALAMLFAITRYGVHRVGQVIAFSLLVCAMNGLATGKAVPSSPPERAQGEGVAVTDVVTAGRIARVAYQVIGSAPMLAWQPRNVTLEAQDDRGPITASYGGRDDQMQLFEAANSAQTPENERALIVPRPDMLRAPRSGVLTLLLSRPAQGPLRVQHVAMQAERFAPVDTLDFPWATGGVITRGPLRFQLGVPRRDSASAGRELLWQQWSASDASDREAALKTIGGNARLETTLLTTRRPPQRLLTENMSYGDTPVVLLTASRQDGAVRLLLPLALRDSIPNIEPDARLRVVIWRRIERGVIELGGDRQPE